MPGSLVASPPRLRDLVSGGPYDPAVPSIDELRTQFKTAQAATEAYSADITEKYRQEYPLPDGWTGLPDPQLLLERARAWTDEERAELQRLRDEAGRIALEIDRTRQAGDAGGVAGP